MIAPVPYACRPLTALGLAALGLASPGLVSSRLNAQPELAPSKRVASSSDQVEVRTMGPMRNLSYEVRAGRHPLRDRDGAVRAHVFEVAYFVQPEAGAAPRPITFAFNGGPGSPAVWLHMGGLGPRVVEAMDAEGFESAPSSRAIVNPDAWLAFTDLVFIDPVGTGYSRPAEGHEQAEFSGFDQDLDACAAYVAQAIDRLGRHESPKYLVGESYGTMRCAGLAQRLDGDHHVRLDGIVLVSTVIDYGTKTFDEGRDLSYALHLPTYAAIAAHHGAGPEPAGAPTAEYLSEVERFALAEYLPALALGDRLGEQARLDLAGRLARYSGLSAEFLLRCDLRPNLRRFAKELLRDRGLTVGRLDGRFTGRDRDDAGDRYEYDSSMANIDGVFLSALRGYLRELGYRSDLAYESLSGAVGEWSYAPPFENGYVQALDLLRSAMHRNRHLRILVCSGLYDLATPYFAAEHSFAHLGLRPEARARIAVRKFASGHMMYIRAEDRARLQREAEAFYRAGR